MADIPRIVRIIRERDDLVETVPDAFIAALEDAQNRLLDEIMDYVKGLESAGGTLTAVPRNVEMAAALRDRMRGWLRRSGFYVAVTELGQEYQTLLDKARELADASDIPATFTRRDLETLSQFKKDDIAFLLGNDQRVINATYSEIHGAIYNNRTFRHLADRLRRLHLDRTDGDKVLRGLLKSYGATYAQTAFAAFDRRVQAIKAQEMGAQRYLYSGGLLRDSREFCVRRAGKVFTVEQIRSWEGMTWKGKISNCDIFTCLGGYNCTHILTPFNLTAKEVRQLEAAYKEAAA